MNEVKTLANEIYSNAEIWIENNLKFFDINNLSKDIKEDLQFKAYIELLFTLDMFFPDIWISRTSLEKIKEITSLVSKNINFSKYFFENAALGSGSEEMIIFYNNFFETPYIEEWRFKLMIKDGIELVARRTPYRILDTAYSLMKANIQSGLPSLESLYNLTVISNENFNYLYLSENSAYSITHTIFYITDMGRKHPKFINYQYIYNNLKNMIIFYGLKNNVDIMGECLLCLLFLNPNNNFKQEDLELITGSLKLIKNRQSKNGDIHSPSNLDDNKLSNKEIFFDNYHTTLVNIGVCYAIQKHIINN